MQTQMRKQADYRRAAAARANLARIPSRTVLTLVTLSSVAGVLSIVSLVVLRLDKVEVGVERLAGDSRLVLSEMGGGVDFVAMSPVGE